MQADLPAKTLEIVLVYVVKSFDTLKRNEATPEIAYDAGYAIAECPESVSAQAVTDPISSFEQMSSHTKAEQYALPLGGM
eukprot:3408408-Pleurochrysis_carterae.AAC.3